MSEAVWMIGVATLIFAGGMAYVLTRLYGWGIALMLPVLALITLTAMRWQNEGLRLQEGMASLFPTLLFASPILLASLVGIALARFGRG